MKTKNHIAANLKRETEPLLFFVSQTNQEKENPSLLLLISARRRRMEGDDQFLAPTSARGVAVQPAGARAAERTTLAAPPSTLKPTKQQQEKGKTARSGERVKIELLLRSILRPYVRTQVPL